MLTVAEARLRELASHDDEEVAINLYGQELNAETYAITEADLLLKGEGEEAGNVRLGSILSQDGFPTGEFDFMLSNPPSGKSWKTDLDRMAVKESFAIIISSSNMLAKLSSPPCGLRGRTLSIQKRRSYRSGWHSFTASAERLLA